MKKNFSQQNISLENLFQKALTRAVFPGAAAAVIQGYGKSMPSRSSPVNPGSSAPLVKDNDNKPASWIYCCGNTSYSKYAPQAVNEKTMFDLASLTKPLATLPALLALMTAGKLAFTTPLEELLECQVPADKKKITLADLLTHRSGLPAYLPFYERLKKKPGQRVKQELLQFILRQPLVYPTGSRSIYSDPGFILAGFIIERCSGKELARYLAEDIYQPLGLRGKLFFNSRGRMVPGNYAVGEYCLWRRRLLRGEVGDENCALLGGVAGHAGLFGTISAVAEMLEYFLALGWGDTPPARGKRLIKREHFLSCCQPWDATGKNTWAAGFDTPSPGHSSGGPYLSATSIGHLGYSGTSFWLDPQRQLAMVLLSNRVHPCRSNNQIKQFRPLFHQKTMEKLVL